MDPAGYPARTRDHGTKADDAESVSEIPGPTVGGGVHVRAAVARRDQTARLHWKPDSLATAAQNMASGSLRGAGGGPAAAGICVAADHLLRGRGRVVYQTAAAADGTTGGESRSAEVQLSRLRDDAPTRHAVPRHFARTRHGQVKHVAG